ncbi:MAG: type I-C CRISPR-associated endonuclease Cas1c [Phycisphaerae bacterium]
MKHHLNTLFVTTPRAYLRREGESVLVRVENETRLRTPIHHLGAIVTFGSIGFSPSLLELCATRGVSVSFLKETGRFMANVVGPQSGNVLLRRTQFETADDEAAALPLAKSFVLGKIANTRIVLLRAAREATNASKRESIGSCAKRLGFVLNDVEQVGSLDGLRGLEGDAARTYFATFNDLILLPDCGFAMNGRSRRPPLDPLNTLLSFLYTLLVLDARGACEAVGLDPQVGFLHALRPGRPSLALDLIEELRPFLADRLALSLINRKQLVARDFQKQEAGGYLMTDDARKKVLVAYQKRKQETIMHSFIGESTTIGLLVHLQARLLARHLRGELDAYPPFIAK